MRIQFDCAITRWLFGSSKEKPATLRQSSSLADDLSATERQLLRLKQKGAITQNQWEELVEAIRNEAYRDQSNTFCTGGIHSTVRDLLTWSRALWRDDLLPEV